MATTLVPVTHHKFTADEYCRMAELGILAPNARVELIEGDIVDMPPIGRGHVSCVARLTHLCVAGLGNRAVVLVQSSIRLAEYFEPEPDIVVLSPRDDFYKSKDAGSEDTLLVIEVADTSLRYDRDVKVPLYARAGIPEVWLVDLQARRITIYRDPSPTGYARVREVSGDEELSPLAFPDFALTAARILG
ncbi:MAG TPA: Uma2 family endonuclease [Chloroflexota bacterium]|jgi:hypothetical protein